MTRMDVHTTEPHSSWKNKAESVIKIMKVKANRRRVQINLSNRIWDFGMVWEYNTYYRTADKYGCSSLEHLRCDTIDIS